MKIHNFSVTGMSHYIENILELAIENPDYKLDDEELCMIYTEGGSIYRYTFSGDIKLVPEPDNPYDSNALRVDLNNLTIGYIKKGACSQVKNLLKADNFLDVTLEFMRYGEAKVIYYDDYDDQIIENREYAPYAKITITNGEPIISQVIEIKPQMQITPLREQKFQKKIQSQKTIQTKRQDQPQKQVQPKKQKRPQRLISNRKGRSIKKIVFRIILTIIGITLVLMSIGAYEDTIIASIIFFILATICFVIGWWPR